MLMFTHPISETKLFPSIEYYTFSLGGILTDCQSPSGSMSALQMLLLLTITWLAVHAFAQEEYIPDYCLPLPGAMAGEDSVNATLAAELNNMTRRCCQEQVGECRAAGGVCIPSHANAFCRMTVDCLCPSGSCTCCFFQLPCKGICGFNEDFGICRTKCRPNERPIPGNCPCGDTSAVVS
ncbi:uncharacterized protein LOC119584616 [Penaeus monodon]|uniref:uncharacterized protein LOC119584616 n=1 Tax=Penaeus monodon TaxID=6687 RepID=UPI0018A7D579|nr:uncharacterized protein LOC119584616 [Penaeus monodon]